LFRLCLRTLDRCALDQMVVASLLLEKLREMVLAVEDPLQGCIVGWCDGTATMGAFEAGLVVGLFFNCYLQCFIKKSTACFVPSRTATSKNFFET
jgi:hypothetical protein